MTLTQKKMLRYVTIEVENRLNPYPLFVFRHLKLTSKVFKETCQGKLAVVCTGLTVAAQVPGKQVHYTKSKQI
jgi:hypothetical protein